ncbi:HlyB/MsbA family ABC transporter [Coprinopsis marcescibilis]|uniref:HlyB/MsbA family ABC transporter n=1 Tax=Coprinopsis marcescibilis TaxID=230819 RepID=A0A5C3KVQ5_COPMA|nr:HlyB/MsbA family ABC transporter [Coprinopsis marcescibilis]
MSRMSTSTKSQSQAGVEDPAAVKHTKVGVWELYEDATPKRMYIPLISNLETLYETSDALPYVWRMLKDIANIRGCMMYLSLYLVLELGLSLLPALTVWYSGQLLRVVEEAVEKRTVDKYFLIRIAIGRCITTVATKLFQYVQGRVSIPLNLRIKRYYALRTFWAMARLDLPTFEDDLVQQQLQQSVAHSSRSSIAWDVVATFLKIGSAAIRLVSEIFVLTTVLEGQQDGKLLLLLACTQLFIEWYGRYRAMLDRRGVWAATTENKDYITSEGLKRVVSSSLYRKEVVAGGMRDYLWYQFKKRMERIGDKVTDFWDEYFTRSRQIQILINFVQAPLSELPRVIFCLRAVQYPASIPISLTSHQLVTSTVQSFSSSLFDLFEQTSSIAEKLQAVRKLYDSSLVPNRLKDGQIPFPEDQARIAQGVELEFRNVSFRYPGIDTYVLENVSFKIDQGQLCVLVGDNGSGKSTLLKLAARLYDPSEGQILLNGLDIRTLKLEDLRRATSVLFQDYTLFPLTLAENIGYGDPSHATEMERIREAARLGGADDFIQKLPDGYNSYLERPVSDIYSNLPGMSKMVGKAINHSKLRKAGGKKVGRGLAEGKNALSGGQMQRVALSRTFMRSLLASETTVGILLFDEPSASLDPTAEHDLFERLRELRGNKTMIFSSHRFGKLTRNADLILYINNGSILEAGKHDDLMKIAGEYARIWNLQAEAFL